MTTATAAPDAVIHALPRAMGLFGRGGTARPAGHSGQGAGAFVLLGGAVYLRGRR